MQNSRTYEICNVNVQRASMQKHLRSKKHLENIKQNEMIIPDWLFKEERSPNTKKIQKVYNLKTINQPAREKTKLNDRDLAKILIISYYFIDENLKIGFKIKLESHNISHAISILTIIPDFPEFGIEFRYIIKIIKNCLLFILDFQISINIIITHFFQGAFIKLMKKTKEITKLDFK